MKFINFLVSALVAATAQAVPIEERSPVEALVQAASVEERSPVGNTEVVVPALVKRDDSEFNIFQGTSCQGSFRSFSLSGNGAKTNFPFTAHSVQLIKLTNNFHLTLYTELNQGGGKSRFAPGQIGECFNTVSGGWLSAGIFSP